MEALDLSKFFTTKEEANDFLSRITKISEMMFQVDFTLEKTLHDQLGITKSDHFVTLLRENNINTEAKQAVKDFLQLLQEKIVAMPVLSMTIAFEPQEQTMRALSEWFLVNMNRQMLFDITVDKKLVAGSAINYNGKFFDFSIRPILERILADTLSKPAEKPTTETHQDINAISLGR
jgi:F0F1-type ATP synthase delta subunit